MAETPKITLDNHILGMSSDEYVGGGFLYGEGINTYSNSKSFKLGPKVVHTYLNRRSNGQGIAIEYCVPQNDKLIFSSDGYIENINSFNAQSGSYSVGGGIYQRMSGGVAKTYRNGLAIGSTILGIGATTIDRISYTNTLWNPVGLFQTPGLTADTGWTVGAGWTTGPSGATHTSGGGTATLTQSQTTAGTGKYRVAIKISGCTTGSCTVKRGASTVLGTLNSSSDVWTLFVATSTTTPEAITFTPTDTFNGAISYVQAYAYDMAQLLEDDITINTADDHPVYLWQGDIYIGSGEYLDIVNTVDWTVRTVTIVDPGYLIVKITQIGGTLIIWASDGNNSKQYFWNGTDEQASEVIDRKGMNITNAISDESKSYVLVGGRSNDKRVYLSSGYSRQLIAKNTYNGYNVGFSYTKYNISKKFNFYDYNSNSLSILNDKLYVPSYGGIYTYGNVIPGFNDAWNKDIINDTAGSKIPYVTASILGSMYFCHDQLVGSVEYNTVSFVREYQNAPTGYLVSNSILRDNLSTEKELSKLKIGFKNVKSTYGNIKISAIVDDNYFWTFDVTGVTTAPLQGDVYNVSTYMTLEVISTNITAGSGTISARATALNFIVDSFVLGNPLTKVSGSGDASITTTTFTNMILLKTIESDNQGYGSEAIFGQSFVDTYMPNWRKINLVYELNTSSLNLSPEVYDVNVLSNIVKNDI